MKRVLALTGLMSASIIPTSFQASAQIAAPAAVGRDQAEVRARATESRMTDAERTRLTHGIMALPYEDTPLPAEVVLGAGYVTGVARLGVPALRETDASLGVSWVGGARKDGATALPSGLAMGATWNPPLLHIGGATIASEAHAKGFNVLLAGGINLVRDPRGGRNFEYLGEDPLHAGLLGGAAVAGIQSEHVISTVKHLALNATETARQFHNAVIGEPALRMSDLLAFQIAIETGKPGAVMCAYNKINGAPACASDVLLNQILKREWGFKGFVMSDWGAVDATAFALSGLDQQSGEQLDPAVFFGDPLLAAAKRDPVYRTRLSEMNRRVLHAIYAVGVDSFPARAATIGVAANAAVAQNIAEQGIVLLRNRGDVLPLAATAKRIAVIGGMADAGVLSGGGSSQTQGAAGPSISIPSVGAGPFSNLLAQNYHPSSPLTAIRSRAANAEVTYRDGRYITDAVAAARKADVAIVFATQWTTEGLDVPDLDLPSGQNALIEAVTAANPNTIVVLETGGPVLMPWLDKTAAVVEAWYPGARGGEAIARVLFGDVNPSGRLPLTFPAAIDQLPRPSLPGAETIEPNFLGNGKPGDRLTIDYNIEGSDVGYRWFARRGLTPLFPFGFGLSYTRFTHSAPTISTGLRPEVRFVVRNVGQRAGADVAQLYLVATPAGPARRLVAFARTELAAGAGQPVGVDIDPRLLAEWAPSGWHLAAGTYRFALGTSADDLGAPTSVVFGSRDWK